MIDDTRATDASSLKTHRELLAAHGPSPPRNPVVSQPTSHGTESLPPYARTLLKVELPVTVTLAKKKEHIHHILDIVPGAIIQFDKSCEEMLELEVGGHCIALGETVKVGDKFGLRITSMVLPDERFKPLRGTAQK